MEHSAILIARMGIQALVPFAGRTVQRIPSSEMMVLTATSPMLMVEELVKSMNALIVKNGALSGIQSVTMASTMLDAACARLIVHLE